MAPAATGPVPSSPAVSSRMSQQGRQDTAQEVAVRKLLYAKGLRYRLQRKVPGMARRTIDIAFPGPRVAVFLDGCFWHGCPTHATSPRANADWWRAKLEKNVARDNETTAHLRASGWTVLRFWEHEPPEACAEAIADAVETARGDTSPEAG
ncbi:very short patch repair endonuclease [Streptomyces sp. enrichment culture]|uniref:very short patch repair endonuclease n=1 Tax=Streptomyces sp. enrichment culture TaxID=1795815 RepID=UPI003F551689